MTVLWRDKTLAEKGGNLESVVIYDKDGANQVEVTNGVFVTLHGIVEGYQGNEAKKAHLTNADDANNRNILLVANPEVLYDEREELDDYVNKAGKVVRAFRLFDGDVISMTVDLLEQAGDIEVEDVLAVGADGLLVKADEAPDATEPRVKFVVLENAQYELTNKQKAWRLAIEIG